jgi:hypothetical protein
MQQNKFYVSLQTAAVHARFWRPFKSKVRTETTLSSVLYKSEFHACFDAFREWLLALKEKMEATLCGNYT